MLVEPVDSTKDTVDTNLEGIENDREFGKMNEGNGGNSCMYEENAQPQSKKRKNCAIEDDFFALTLFTPKKKGNKHKKNKERSAKDILIEYEEAATFINSSDSNAPSQKNSQRLTEEIPKKMEFINRELGELLSTSVLDDSDDEIVILDAKDNTSNGDDRKSEANRKYHIHVTSKIPVKSRTLSHTFTAIGSTFFKTIIKDAIVYFFKDLTPSIDNFTLVWIEGKMELKSFFKPSILGIPRANRKRITEVNCLLIPRENASNFQNIYDEFRHMENNDILEQLGREIIETTKTDNDVIILDDDVKREQENEYKNEKYFNIGLKGKDNKRVTVQVSSATKLKALLDHYLKIKNIKVAEAKNAKLIFDDETLDLNCEVGDTELEEEFEVQIVI